MWSIPFTVVIVAIGDYRCVDYDSDKQRDDIDDETGEHHESRAARSCAPSLVRPAGFPSADVHVCGGVGSGRRKAVE